LLGPSLEGKSVNKVIKGELMTWRLLVCWSVKQKETKGNKKEIKLRKERRN
jgi:hypothetical protein